MPSRARTVCVSRRALWLTMKFDPRITAARADLAAESLRGKVDAPRYVEGHIAVVRDPQTALRRAPSHEAPLDTEALYGERIRIFETNGEGWCWGQLESDGYVGYVSENALVLPQTAP